jgi:hypothetical protein
MKLTSYHNYMILIGNVGKLAREMPHGRANKDLQIEGLRPRTGTSSA